MNLWHFARPKAKLLTDTVYVDGKQKIDSFRLLAKPPMSRTWVWSEPIKLDHTYPVLQLIEQALNKRAPHCTVYVKSRYHTERVVLYYPVYKRIHREMRAMIRTLQKQY